MIRRLLTLLSCLIVLAAAAPVASVHAVAMPAAAPHQMAGADHHAMAMDVGGDAPSADMAGCCIGGLASCSLHLSAPSGQPVLHEGDEPAKSVLRPNAGRRLHGIAQDVPYEPPRA